MNFLRHLIKFIGSLILLVLVAAAVTFAVANRTLVTVSLWPLPIDVSLPLGATILAALALGVLAGTGLMGLSRYKFRRQARSNERRAATLEKVARDATTTLPAAISPAPKTGPRQAMGSH